MCGPGVEVYMCMVQVCVCVWSRCRGVYGPGVKLCVYGPGVEVYMCMVQVCVCMVQVLRCICVWSRC